MDKNTVKHTPGTYCAEYGQRVVCSGVILATAHAPRSEGPGAKEERKANAHLFSAAPDLLEVVKDTRQYVQACLKGSDGQMRAAVKYHLDKLDAAIAKAEGRE